MALVAWPGFRDLLGGRAFVVSGRDTVWITEIRVFDDLDLAGRDTGRGLRDDVMLFR
ncbi:hypothetical protein [Actinomadura rudentiformis]|uniref:hypothetical protein n=1 Tax=Actinomadura rudentiformis TaxID=359158 RepID=UPI00178C292F|nr:hypothetical protein [Actinomadura rudentiformis]